MTSQKSSEAKVNQFDGLPTRPSKHNVFRLDVSMHNISLVKKAYGLDHLCKAHSNHIFLKPILKSFRSKVTTTAVFHADVDLLVALIQVIDLDYVRMVQHFQDVYFSFDYLY